jgi:hypothetical protein
MKEKIIASFLAAIMAMVTFTFPVLAASTLGDFPGFLATTSGSMSTPDVYFVVGKVASPEDVIAAVDVAATVVSAISYTTTSTTGGESVDGVLKDGINIGTSSGINSGSNQLSTGITGGAAFPSSCVLKNAHYSKLKDGTYSWNSNDYDYREQVDCSGISMRHDLGADKVNGTETMVVRDSDLKYEFVFEKAINLTSKQSLGTIASKEYSYPIKIKLLGRDFVIVGIGTDRVAALQGSVGTATATVPVVYGDYSVYATQGGSSFVSVTIKDKAGTTVDTILLTGWAAGSSVSKDSSAAGLTITATSIAALQDGTVVGADLVVGPTGTTTHEYDGAADVSSTSATSKDTFSGETKWGIQYVPAAGYASGYIPTNSKIQVVYLPQSVTNGDVEYVKAGSKVSLPNNYADLGFIGFNTNIFEGVTVKAMRSTVSAYNSSENQIGTSFYGISIETSGKNIIYSNPQGNMFTKAYVLFNATKGGALDQMPVAVGFYDTTKGKVIVNDSFAGAAAGTAGTASGSVKGAEYAWKNMNFTQSDTFNYSFKLNNGEYDYWLNIYIANSTAATYPDIINVTAGSSAVLAATDNVRAMFLVDSAPSASAAMKLKLGSSQGSGEADEVLVYTEGTLRNGGKVTQEVVSDSGLIVGSTASSTSNDALVLKVPAKNLAVKAYFGTLGATTTSGTVNAAEPVTFAVAKLDSEVTSAEKAKNLVVVGDAAVNTVAADVMNLTFPTYGSSGLFPYKSGEALIKIYEGKFTSGKVVLLVAGWDAKDTRTAASVLQQYKTLLKGSTATAIKVTSAQASGITTV